MGLFKPLIGCRLIIVWAFPGINTWRDLISRSIFRMPRSVCGGKRRPWKDFLWGKGSALYYSRYFVLWAPRVPRGWPEATPFFPLGCIIFSQSWNPGKSFPIPRALCWPGVAEELIPEPGNTRRFAWRVVCCSCSDQTRLRSPLCRSGFSSAY